MMSSAIITRPPCVVEEQVPHTRARAPEIGLAIAAGPFASRTPSGEVATMRDFNTAGPVRADQHYCIPPLDRLNLSEVLALVAKARYFVLHAPRQTGKTSALLALRNLLNGGSEGDYRCVYVNVETAQMARENVGLAMTNILHAIRREARTTLGDARAGEIARSLDATIDPNGVLGEFLALWCEADPRPLVLLIDEIDALVGDSLISVLRQLRAGYPGRSERFPQSVVLCGVRDVRDYRIHASSEKQVIAGGSAFNIKARSLRLGDFTEAEVRALLGQHTGATGQQFTPEALDAVWEQTRGQPWLVNALAKEMCFEHEAVRLRQPPIAEHEVYEAREALILRRETHLDQLADKLREPRVRRVIEPLLSGGDAKYSDRDREYVRDLGLVAPDPPLRIANPVYAEVVPRELTWVLEDQMPQQTAWYVEPDGSLSLDKLLAAFQQFFRENSEHWVERAEYREAGPQLVLQAFLHRVVNGAGRIEREYALGSRRVDLLIIWPSRTGAPGRFVVECKLLRGGRAQTVEKGLEQTAAYMDLCGAGAGHLVIFDVRPGKSWGDRVFREDRVGEGRRIVVWGM